MIFLYFWGWTRIFIIVRDSKFNISYSNEGFSFDIEEIGISLLNNRKGEHSVVIWVDISSLTNENWKGYIEEVSGYLLNRFLINTFIGEASFKDMLPPSSDVLSNLLSENPGVFCLFIFLSEAVYDIIGPCAYYLDAFLLTNFCVMSLEHRYRCFESAWHFIFDVMSF